MEVNDGRQIQLLPTMNELWNSLIDIVYSPENVRIQAVEHFEWFPRAIGFKIETLSELLSQGCVLEGTN